MYSYEDRMRAVALYIKLGKRPKATIRQLGYPSKNALKCWYLEYEHHLDLRLGFTIRAGRLVGLQWQTPLLQPIWHASSEPDHGRHMDGVFPPVTWWSPILPSRLRVTCRQASKLPLRVIDCVSDGRIRYDVDSCQQAPHH
ncbi:hypothetical protein J3U99_19470 [Brucella pituitosa]|uniref:hypothetical protein n=1 Tax=Brucella pituitosa TaxID=571256 RepID=UPI00200445BA|nr:hypothetical protein [Brucella pituitosa]